MTLHTGNNRGTVDERDRKQRGRERKGENKTKEV